MLVRWKRGWKKKSPLVLIIIKVNYFWGGRSGIHFVACLDGKHLERSLQLFISHTVFSLPIYILLITNTSITYIIMTVESLQWLLLFFFFNANLYRKRKISWVVFFHICGGRCIVCLKSEPGFYLAIFCSEEPARKNGSFYCSALSRNERGWTVMKSWTVWSFCIWLAIAATGGIQISLLIVI